MRDDKRKRLEAKGWKVGSPAEFLEMSTDEVEYLEIRRRLADGLKAQRLAKGVTQVALAKAVRSSQSRIAKMEAGDPSVSLDLLVRTLLALGASKRDLATIIARAPSRHAA
jgi:ribosome-binding protein aMBF1 (putative translation factor)